MPKSRKYLLSPHEAEAMKRTIEKVIGEIDRIDLSLHFMWNSRAVTNKAKAISALDRVLNDIDRQLLSDQQIINHNTDFEVEYCNKEV